MGVTRTALPTTAFPSSPPATWPRSRRAAGWGGRIAARALGGGRGVGRCVLVVVFGPVSSAQREGPKRPRQVLDFIRTPSQRPMTPPPLHAANNQLGGMCTTANKNATATPKAVAGRRLPRHHRLCGRLPRALRRRRRRGTRHARGRGPGRGGGGRGDKHGRRAEQAGRDGVGAGGLAPHTAVGLLRGGHCLAVPGAWRGTRGNPFEARQNKSDPGLARFWMSRTPS